MKNPLIYILMLSLLFAGKTSAQQQVCMTDTVKLHLSSFRGQISWQTSINGTDFSDLAGEAKNTLTFVADSQGFYRAVILEGSCAPVYSGVIELIPVQPPVVTLRILDSICISESAFILDGGYPAGGSYSGTGVGDGKFNPWLAGPGEHQVIYHYEDTASGCKGIAADWIRVIPMPDSANAGDDLTDLEGDSVRLNALAPQTGIGSWIIVSGEHGRLSDPDDPKSWFVRGENQYDYLLEWRVENPCQSNSDQVTINFRYTDPFACPGTPTVTDADGNVYPTVLIGNQCWMAKSLNVGRFVQSTQTNSAHSNMGNNGIVEKYCFNNDPANCELYGALYEWNEAMGYTETPGVQGICPDGWHIPDNDDWKELNEQYKYNDAGKYLKVGGGSGFEGHLSGDRHANGGFVSFNSSGFYWSSSSYVYLHYNEGYYRELCACNPYLEEGRFSKLTGASIRCIKNRE